MKLLHTGVIAGLVLFCTAQFTWARSGEKTSNLDRRQYEERIQQLEARLEKLEKTVAALTSPTPTAPLPELKAPEPVETAMVSRPRYEPPPELIPEIGKIGAEVGVFAGGSASPFKLNTGSFTGGFIDLPLFDQPSWLHGKISYEISIGLTRSKSTFNTTSNVAQVANLTVLNALNPTGGLQNVTQAITGTGAAPFPTTSSTATQLRLLQVVPFALKYTSTALDRWRIRPYVVAGFGTYVTIHVQNPAHGTPANYGVRPDADLPPAILAAVGQTFGGQAPFGGPLVAGQISQSPELETRGLPGGHGNFDIGLHTGGGIAFRLTKDLSFGFDARYNKISGANGGFATYGTRVSLHF